MQTYKKAKENPFLWKHYEGEIILLNVGWYCSYGLSYRNLVEMMEERGMEKCTVIESKK